MPEYQNVILSLIQPLQSILRILNSAGMSLCIELARLRRIAARSVCSPCGKNGGIIRLGEREACPCAARFGSTLEHYPRRANISLTEQRAGARDQPRRLRLPCGSTAAGCAIAGTSITCAALEMLPVTARSEVARTSYRAPRRLDFSRHCLGSVALLLQRLSQVRHGALRRLLELLHFLARLAQLRRLRLVFALRRGEFARQCGTACVLLVERLTMFRRAVVSSCRAAAASCARAADFLPLLFERLRAVPRLPPA